MKKLELPITVHLATKDEVANTPEILSNILRSEQANLVEGYTLHGNTTTELPFAFFSEININNSRLWNLFEALLSGLPHVSCLVYGHIDTEPYYSQYLERPVILEKITEFKDELSLDGFLEFGLLYQDDDKLIEVFIKKAKYIQYWGTDEVFFTKVMADFGLQNIEDINFVDEFPLVTESLSLKDSKYTATEDIINNLKDYFKN
ncbi:hypothetical protein AM493_02200 [Flavobacterium akiainvivens]|uniref:Uncharacterized protein n=1 Tax=Flavobacterium akiainvivens TaxID=1202724 RepID=A0A0M9VH65_9FLAO|nr:hypothetical protein [Flavobacterium akiainvivens]KOS04982.1 hypothetical protein AM493_02200 [Flavobacterium akiainvivens]SFQ41014.1 hypothetical protein SAMN05444144_10478 [Flavobacterium akiainvivens]